MIQSLTSCSLKCPSALCPPHCDMAALCPPALWPPHCAHRTVTRPAGWWSSLGVMRPLWGCYFARSAASASPSFTTKGKAERYRPKESWMELFFIHPILCVSVIRNFKTDRVQSNSVTKDQQVKKYRTRSENPTSQTGGCSVSKTLAFRRSPSQFSLHLRIACNGIHSLISFTSLVRWLTVF